MTWTLAEKKAKLNAVGLSYFKDLNDPKISTAIINGGVDWECIIRLGNSMVQGALGAIPVFGPAVAAVADFMFTFILSAITNNADPMASYKKLLRKALTEYEQATLKAEFKGISDSMELLHQALETANNDRNDWNCNAAFTQFIATNTVVTDRIPNLCKEGYEVVGFPYYHKVAIFHLLMILDVTVNPLYNITDAKRQEFSQLLESKKIEYINIMNETYEKGINKLIQDRDLPWDFRDRVGDGTSFEVFNAIMEYRNSVLLESYDSMYQLIFLDTKFASGFQIYNPRVLIGPLVGQPINSMGTPSSVNQMLSLLETQDAYSYNGDLKGVDLYISTSDNYQFIQSIQNQYLKNNILPRPGKLLGIGGSGNITSIKNLNNPTSVDLAYMWRSIPSCISGAYLNVMLKGIGIGGNNIGVTDSIANKSDNYSKSGQKLQNIVAFHNVVARTSDNSRDYPLGLDAVVPTWIPSDGTTDINYLHDTMATVISPKRYFLKEDSTTIQPNGGLVGWDTVNLKINEQIMYKVVAQNKSVLNYKIYLRVKSRTPSTLVLYESITEKQTFNIGESGDPQLLQGVDLTLPTDDYFSFYYNLKVTGGDKVEIQALIFVPQ